MPLDNPRHERFAQIIASGTTKQHEAYKAVYTDCAQSTADVNASKLLADSDISARVIEIQQQLLQRVELLTLTKKRSLLSQFAQADLSKDSSELLPIAQSAKYDRETGLLTEIKLPSKIEAIQLDARLAGELESDQARGPVVVNITLQRMLLAPASEVVELETGCPNRPD